MKIVDLREARVIAAGTIATISKEQKLGVRIITDTGYLVILNQMEASRVCALYSGEKVKPVAAGAEGTEQY